MAVDHQPTFSRTSLNILMLVCVVLILIFGQSSQESTEINIPPAPKLNVSTWTSDSGAKIWFSPKVDEHIAIQLDYLAGFAYNQAPFLPGSSYLLMSLLNQEAQQESLPIHFQLSADFLSANINLSTEPLTMKQQIKGIKTLLYRPHLDSKALQNAKLILQQPHDALWASAFSDHPYAGPKQGSQESLNSIHRASVQRFQQTYLHPQRLFVGISGNINQQAAQVILESLLPKSKYPVQAITKLPTASPSTHTDNNLGLILLRGSHDNTDALIQQRIGYCVLKSLPVLNSHLIHNQMNNVLIIEQWSEQLAAMDTQINSDMIREAKRQCIKQGFAHTHNAQALSAFLAWLNRYHLPSHFLQLEFDALATWQEKDWQILKQNWFYPATD